ncbi:sensor histidine kinase [Aeromicrobium sp. CTD01-1L150]|uniref:sensor histidine kinase n=1 Tax=Aeromicrobium sp. CTD01-1L150 TaxID=3341830 RepID=UPI0035C02456
MPGLDDIARFQTSLDSADLDWLHALVSEWQIIADLSFSDLVLWLDDAESKGTWASAQIRPTTGPTTLLEDVVGTFVPAGGEPALERVLQTGSSVGATPGGSRESGSDVVVSIAPVRRGERVVAALAMRSPRSRQRSRGDLESTYRECADRLVAMIGSGRFPALGARSELADSLRVGDGFIRIDADGLARYASPNAMSAYRRLGVSGDLVGSDLAELTARLDGRPTHHASRVVLAGREPGEKEVENSSAAVLLRVIPLARGTRADGAVVLLRDVTELRLRERELVSKEATIREIHHRVKNNLQTVAALLRLQSRRLDLPEAREALEEAVRRVGSIALVHETLSQSFDEQVEFDTVADRLLRSVLDVGGSGIQGERIGTFGRISGEQATPLAMALTELVQNVAEHAYPEMSGTDATGRVTVAVNRIRGRIRMRVSDDGVGLPADFDASASLGLSIVSTLVEAELGGTLTFERGHRGGTTVSITIAV